MTDLPLSSTAPVSLHRAEAARRALATVFLINGTLFATWAVNIPGVRDRLGLTAAQVGLALLAVGLGSLVSMPLTGGWTARFGSDRVTRVAVVLSMLALLPPILAPNLVTLVLALALLGALNGALDVAMNAQGVTVERRLARPVMSRFHAYYSLGGVLGALLGTLLIGRVPLLAHAGLVVAVTTLAGFLAGRWLLPDLTGNPVETGAPSRARPGPSAAALLLGGLCFLGMLAEGANYDWATLYFRDVLGLAGGNAGIGYAAFVAAMTLGRWFGDRVRTRLGDEVTVRGGALLTAAGLALALLVHDPLPATLGFALSGLGLSNVVPVLYGTAGHALAGRGIAQVATIGYAGFLLGPPVIGFIAGQVGLPAALGVALAGAALVAGLGGRAFALVRQKRRASAA
ncbi:MFS transporter [Deinococcus metallilatus]|uniref:MFS family arabinose efflux permease n=1 Tax=Deinococcus metallilatus TaxID=1211322 RepID=A0AAJ5F185_9DEIO|nr:MFS transporter [Deinococcus metallilatus]MBB5297346.1 putative MFS family arabinose efflux permease [Deinococcus metallilatus]QBY10123.1 MFS transporter [Deinococcus metallilatus]RXJ08283.1 MFS transporter [Deinococcus metallilatus]TLK21190.1 MFS transporter [Deinococcus metallilatus]GMA17089.1 MFS transporter [Deinococcus metallilatus]